MVLMTTHESVTALQYDGRERTVAITFRLAESKVAALKKEAEQKQLATNVLINHLISDHVEFHGISVAAGIMPFQKKTLIQMVKHFDEPAMSELSKTMAKDFVEFVIMRKGDYSLESFLDSLIAWVSLSGFCHRELIEARQKTVVIQHDMGNQWTAFLVNFLSESFAGLHAKVDFHHSDSMVAIRISGF